MTSKSDILANLPSYTAPATQSVEWQVSGIMYDDPLAQFCSVLEGVGGHSFRIQTWQELNERIEQLPTFRTATRICSLVEGIERANVDLSLVRNPHDLEDLDFCIACGDFGVAENAAVWVDGREIAHRAVLFLAQHVALVVPATSIIHNLHEAYGRLRFEGPGYGVFISGPSKTADIEQSLVIGAHGPRSLTVFLLEGAAKGQAGPARPDPFPPPT